MIWAFSSSDAKKAHHAREQFLSALKLQTAAPDLASCELIFGELIGNVVRHAPGRIRIVLDWSGNQARLCVEDTGPSFDFDPALPANPLEEHGRGLYIVRALAGHIDIEAFPKGKSIRVTLPAWARSV
jgi:anti-sigma regulatory factor (Ser/Thr protein kinase)